MVEQKSKTMETRNYIQTSYGNHGYYLIVWMYISKLGKSNLFLELQKAVVRV